MRGNSGNRGSCLLPPALLAELQRNEELVVAVRGCDLEAARQLLEQGADLHHKQDKALLLALGALDPDSPDTWLPRPRDRAAVLSMCRPLVAMLLAAGADINARQGRAIRQAARWRDSYSLAYLMTLGADPAYLKLEPQLSSWLDTLPQLVKTSQQ